MLILLPPSARARPPPGAASRSTSPPSTSPRSPSPASGCSTRWSVCARATRRSPRRPSASGRPSSTWSTSTGRLRTAPTAAGRPRVHRGPVRRARRRHAHPGREAAVGDAGRGHVQRVRPGAPRRPDPGVPPVRRHHPARPGPGGGRVARAPRPGRHRHGRQRAAGRPAQRHLRVVLAPGRRPESPPCGCSTSTGAPARWSATSTRRPRAASSGRCSSPAPTRGRRPSWPARCVTSAGWSRRTAGHRLDVVVSEL